MRCKDYTFNELGPALAPDHAPPEDSKTEPPAVHNHFYTTGRARSLPLSHSLAPSAGRSL